MTIKRIPKFDNKTIDMLYYDYLCSIGHIPMYIAKYITYTDIIVYGLYIKEKLIGFFFCIYVDDIVVINEVMFYKKYYFKKAMYEVFKFFKENGFKNIITKHSRNTAYISYKYKIFKEIKCQK